MPQELPSIEPIELHIGEDYGVLMRQQDTTDTALIHFFYATHEEMELYGNLFAAALDLLTCSEALLKDIYAEFDRNNGAKSQDLRELSVFSRMEDAIAKAKGQSCKTTS